MPQIRIVSVVMLLSCAGLSWGQQGRGTILGTIIDSSGGAIRGAKVAIVNVETNNTINAETNGEGFFTSPPLIVGKYQVTVEQSGFKKAVRSGITLQVDQHAEINIQLELGSVGESVQVPPRLRSSIQKMRLSDR